MAQKSKNTSRHARDTKKKKKPQNKRQRILLIVLGVLVAGGALYYFLVINSAPAPTAATDQLNEQMLRVELGIEVRDMVPELSTHVLEHPAVEAFRIWGSLPIEVGETGVSNPFSR